MKSNAHIRNQAEVDRLYELLQQRIDSLRSRHGRIPTPRDLPAEQNAWSTKGVYFFFQPGEKRGTLDAHRIVRVGSHSGETSSIESRIVGEHLKDWGRSVFRRHIGTAIILKGEFDSMMDRAERERLAGMWYCRIDGWAVHHSPDRLDPTLHALHPLVSRKIERMALAWVEIADRNERLELEKQCIKLLSNYSRRNAPIDPPSPEWLGRHALSEEVRRSGLWNVQHTKKAHRPGFIADFQKYFLTAS